MSRATGSHGHDRISARQARSETVTMPTRTGVFVVMAEWRRLRAKVRAVRRGLSYVRKRERAGEEGRPPLLPGPGRTLSTAVRRSDAGQLPVAVRPAARL